MGRSQRALLALAAALGFSGCLLFTDPINRAPVVTITSLTDPVTRSQPAEFTATVNDEDNQESFTLSWAVFDLNLQRCDLVTPADWNSVVLTKQASSELFRFTPATPKGVCVCARATDHYGATGQGCVKVTPTNPPLVAQIEDVAGVPSGDLRPLCTQMHLSAEGPTYPPGDKLKFDWSLKYAGSDSAGRAVQLTTCAGVAADKTDQHRCFYAAGPGTYTVTLSVEDSVTVDGNTTTVTSVPTDFTVPVNIDMPPCIQRADPDVYSQLAFLSRTTSLGGSYESRTFTVLSVADDCEPYPLPAGSTNPATQFKWSVFDSTQPSPSWSYPTNASDSFTVSQALFPNARPGDSIKLRVEVRDRAVQKLYESVGQACSSDTVDICCGASACGTPNDCIRWTTWTVQFQP